MPAATKKKECRSRKNSDIEPYGAKECESKKGQYNPEEDLEILSLYQKYHEQSNKWKVIADILNRGHKSIRERYINHLDPNIDKSELTGQEKAMISSLQSNPEYHNKWADIAKKLSENMEGKRRTELQVKNYWNSKNRAEERKNKSEEQSKQRVRSVMQISHLIH